MKKIFTFLVSGIITTGALYAQNFNLVKDLNNIPNSNPAGFSSAEGIIYFSADDGIHGTELWRTDGTATGTYMVKDINKGVESSKPVQMTECNHIIYFKAYTEETGEELWRTDGTNVGTYLVKDIKPGAAFGLSSDESSSWLTAVNGTLFFLAGTGSSATQLWKTDGTGSGTVEIKDFNNKSGVPPTQLINYNSKLYFFGGTNKENGLFKSDGTANGTKLVASVDRSYIDAPVDYEGILTVNNIMYFTAGDGINYRNNELWRSDGTSDGTYNVKDINPGSIGSTPGHFSNFNGILFFDADDGVHGNELWKSNGTDSGTIIIKDIRIGNSYTEIDAIVVMNNYVYFDYYNNTAHELWKSDGTAAHTKKVIDFTNADNLVATSGKLFFFKATKETGEELWKSDGTINNALLVKDILPGAYDGVKSFYLTVIDDAVYFSGKNKLNGSEPWKSDGTDTGTYMIKDINKTSPIASSDPAIITTYKDKLFFTAYNDIYGREPYMSDGTSAGTYMLREAVPGTNYGLNVYNAFSFLDTFYYQDVEYLDFNQKFFKAQQVWKTDGTYDVPNCKKKVNQLLKLS